MNCLMKVRSKVALRLRLYKVQLLQGLENSQGGGTASPEAIGEAKSKGKAKTILPGGESVASISEVLTCAV